MTTTQAKGSWDVRLLKNTGHWLSQCGFGLTRLGNRLLNWGLRREWARQQKLSRVAPPAPCGDMPAGAVAGHMPLLEAAQALVGGMADRDTLHRAESMVSEILHDTELEGRAFTRDEALALYVLGDVARQCRQALGRE